MRARWVLACTLSLGIGVAVAQVNPERDADRAHAMERPVEEETILPDGEGRSETFAYCTACHSTAIVRRSRFNRQQWDGLMDWMADTHGMNPLEGEFRDLIVGYLAQHFGPAQPTTRGRNPFLN